MVGRLITFLSRWQIFRGRTVKLTGSTSWKINGWNIMEVWFQIIFLSQTGVFCRDSCVKLPIGFFFHLPPATQNPRRPSLGISHHQVSHLCDQSNTGAAGGSDRTWSRRFQRRDAVPLAGCKLEKKTRKSKWDVVFVKMKNYLGVYQFISL